MSLQFFNFNRPKIIGKKYIRPLEILSDAYLSPAQKYMVLAAMLSEAREDEEMSSRQNIKFANEVLKAQSLLKRQMD